MRYWMLALVLGLSGCAEWKWKPWTPQPGDMMVICTYGVCTPWTHPAPVGPSSQGSFTEPMARH